MQYINKLKEGDELNSIYHIKTKSQATAKNGKDYFNVQLQDKSGVIDGKIWDVTSVGIEEFSSNDFCHVSGDVISYNNQLQVRISRIYKANKNEFDPADYFATSRFKVSDMVNELDGLINEVKNENYLKLLKSFFIDDKDFREKFIIHQGAKMVHHSFVNGLLEHTISTTNLAKHIAKNYDYLNLDIIITASLLHDIAKVYEISSYPENEYTDEGYLIGHIVMGYEMVKNRIDTLGGFAKAEETELLHTILAHHGSTDFGSPKLPMTMEAYVVSQADNIDAKLEIMKESIQNA